MTNIVYIRYLRGVVTHVGGSNEDPPFSGVIWQNILLLLDKKIFHILFSLVKKLNIKYNLKNNSLKVGSWEMGAYQRRRVEREIW
jgi:hypothetical protein